MTAVAEKRFTYVRTSGPLNSTEFTSCCSTAVMPRETECSSCRRPIWRDGPAVTNNCRMCGQPRSVCYC